MISQRLRGIKADGEAIEEADFMPKLQKAFGDVGVKIQDENGELRSTYDILNDLAAVWDTLNSKQRQYLGEKAAGNRQVKVLNAIMANWDVVQNTIEAANGAADAAMVGNEKFMDSIEGRITQLQSAFQDLARTTINSEFVKWIVSAGTKIVKFTKDAGGLIPVLTTIAGLFVAIKAESLAAGIAKLGTAFKALFSAASGGLQVFTGWVGVALAVGAALAGVVAYVNSTKKSFEDLQGEASEARQEYEQQNTKLKSLEDQLKTVSDRIEELNSKESLTVVEEDELEKLKKVEDSLNNQIRLQKEYTRVAEKETRKTAAAAAQEYQNGALGYKNAKAPLKTLRNAPTTGVYTNKDLANNSDYLNKVIAGMPDELTNTDIAGIWRSILPEMKKAITDEEAEIARLGANKLFGDPTGELAKRQERLAPLIEYYDSGIKFLEDYRNTLSDTVGDFDYIEKPLGESDKRINAALDEIKATDELVTDLSVYGDKLGQFDVITERFPDSTEKIIASVQNLGSVTTDELQNFPDLMQAFADKGWTPEDVAAHFNEIYAAVQEGEGQVTGPATTPAAELSSSVFANTENYQKVLSKAISEQDKSGVLSSETWANLLAVLPEVSDYLTLTANGYMLNTEALYGYIDAQNEYAKLEATKGLIEQQKALEEVANGTRTFATEEERLSAINAIQREADQYAAVIREIDAATGALARYRAAKETQNQDTDFNEGQNAYKDLTEGWKSGKVGTDDFKSSLGFFLGDNWEKDYQNLEDAYKAAEEIGKKYFGQDDERKGMLNYAKDLEEKGFGKFEGDNFELFSTRQLENGEEVAVTIQDIAKELGISEDAANSLFGLMETYGAEFERPEIVTEEDKKLAEELNKIEEERVQHQENIDKLKEEETASGVDNTEAIKKEEDALKTLDSMAEEVSKQLTSSEPAEPPLTVEEAQEKITELQAQIDTLTNAGAGIEVVMMLQLKKDQLETFISDVESGNYNKEATITYTSIFEEEDKENENNPEHRETQNQWEETQRNLEAFERYRDNLQSSVEWLYGNKNSVGKAMGDLANGPVDLLHRPVISSNKLLDMGYNVDPNDIATVFSHSYNVGENGEVGIIVTPILPDGDVLEPSSLQEAVDSIFVNGNGELELPEGMGFSLDDILIHSWDMSNIPEEFRGSYLDTLAEVIHNLQEDYYAEDNPFEIDVEPKEDNNALFREELEAQFSEIPATVEVEPEPEKGSIDLLREDIEEQFEKKEPTVEVEPVSQGAPTSPGETSTTKVQTFKETRLDVVAQPNTESEEEAIEEMQSEADSNPIEVDVNTVSQAKEGASELIGQAEGLGIEGAKEDIKELQSATMWLTGAMQQLQSTDPSDTDAWNSASENFREAAENFSTAYNNLSAKVSAVQTVSVDANTSKAIQKIDKLSERKVTVTVDATTTGPQNAKGTRNASAGPSLVDERGAELIEHTSRGTFELGTNNGPRFTTLDKGDVVHTAEETKRIMSRLGKIGGFFRDGLNKAKSVFTGGAHATGISGSMSWSLINKTLKKVQSSGSGSSSTSSKSSSKSKNSTKNISKWAEKLFDWAEIRLERLQTITNTWLLSAAEAIGYIAKNKELENAITSVENQIKDTTAAYDLYMNQADEVAKRSNLSADIVQKIKDGSIEISEYDKKIQENIKFYQEWLKFSCHREQ